MTAPLITQLPTPPDYLVLQTTFPQVEPAHLFRHWIDPRLLTQWWPPQAILMPHIGGRYHLTWPDQGWHLRGHLTDLLPAQRLAFTWKWDHDPATASPKEVIVEFAPVSPSGTLLTITHAPYTAAPDDQALRNSHLDGWTHFLGQLYTLTVAPPLTPASLDPVPPTLPTASPPPPPDAA